MGRVSASRNGRAVQQSVETSVYLNEMFRPDPKGAHSVEETIAKLSDVLAEVPPDSPRAQRLVGLIRRLREGGEFRAVSVTGVARG